MLNEAKVGILSQVLDIRRPPGNEVVDTDHSMALGDKAVAEVGAEKSGSAGDQSGGHEFTSSFRVSAARATSSKGGLPEGRPMET